MHTLIDSFLKYVKFRKCLSMKIVQINSVHYGSTGKIMLDLEKIAGPKHAFLLCYPKGRHNKGKIASNCYPFGNRWSEDFHIILGRLTGLQGCFSIISTKKLIKKITKFKPDILHLHNLHNSYINIPILMNFIKKNDIRVIWTLHDCWAFTGHCPHFQDEACEKWKYECNHCNVYKQYPKCYIDHSTYMYHLKKRWFRNVRNMEIVTPSRWLQELVKESFLSEYPTTTIYNGVDLEIFKPVESDIREKYNCNNKFIILGVAFGWTNKKGLDTFIELSMMLDKRYQIILVGTDSNIDKLLPNNIISIHRTNNQIELAELYSAADIFVNPTKEDVLGLVNLEALACGTPVIVNNAGGCVECIDETCGIVVQKNDTDKLKNSIIDAIENKRFSRDNCRKRAEKFDMLLKYNEYLKLYEKSNN